MDPITLEKIHSTITSDLSSGDIQTLSLKVVVSTCIDSHGHLLYSGKTFFKFIAENVTELLDLALMDSPPPNPNPNRTNAKKPDQICTQEKQNPHGKDDSDDSDDSTYKNNNNEKIYFNGQSYEECSKTAFLLLSNGSKYVVDALIKDYTFFIKATTILNQNEISPKLAGRIAAIFVNIINRSKESSINAIGFLTQLIRFIRDPSVFDLYHTMTMHKKRFNEMQILMSQVNLDSFVIEELSKVENSPDTFYDVDKKLNLCLFIQDCLKNSILMHSFQNDRILKKLIELMDSEVCKNNIYLLNQVWQAISLLPSPKTIPKMQSLIKTALEIINKKVETIHIYHSSVFEFLSQITSLKPTMLNDKAKNDIILSIKFFIREFPSSTSLMTPIFRVIRASMASRDFSHKVLSNLMPLFINLAQSKNRNAASASATQFLADMERMKTVSIMINKSLSINAEYTAFYKSTFKKYLEEMNKPYGGPVTKFVNKEKPRLERSCD
ncbi:hypothetical protein TRFO_05305 [Tritrichomonas foetus]|uniref:Uncharacterized protein n=1 Tax=Tritrichomonas foetus TaxID=1144522 RepID=A0A1J4K7B4_9EUKA|nr:hypothetical protein TRFO_05305 [Tritrichomonas foetus]|eukprot:OHT07091.1 hypothetical protein TRFO_05305 [Tritrichomonas foetus]